MKVNNNKKQSGAVSLFVVIFAALLMTVVTVSFVRIMIQKQQQASSSDLSQSAFDSAQAGVEDAKRALLRYQDICKTGGDCAAAKKQVNSEVCNEAVSELTDVKGNVVPSGNEVIVQNAGTSNALDQAYTCVKITTDTDDIFGYLEQESSEIISLIGVSNFNKVRIEWFSDEDLQGSGETKKVQIPESVSGSPLQRDWVSLTQQNRPSIMRAQLIEFNKSGFSLDDFDDNDKVEGSNNTLFLYPSDKIDLTKSFKTDNIRPAAPTNIPTQIYCKDITSGGYSCLANIKLPVTVTDNNHGVFLILKSLYKGTHYRVTLYDNTDKLVKFDGVQPSVDSTGRANDIFRRVQSRLQMMNVDFPYPNAEINIKGNLCKDFMVTNDPTPGVGYFPGSCTP